MTEKLRAHGVGAATAATILGFAVVQLDVSIVNVALDQIGRTLRTDLAGLSWVVDAYTLAFAAALLSGGALGDRIGALRCYVGGLTAFTIASIACALAPDVRWLIAARAAQGLGAAVLMPCSLSLLTQACGDDAGARAKAVGVWTATGGVALAAGPAIGGFLVSFAGWRSIFFVNAPVGALAVWLALRYLDETKPIGGGFDVVGQVLCAVALFGATDAVIEAGSHGPNAVVAWGAAAAVSAGLGFVAAEAYGRSPMLPLGFFRNASFSAATAVGFCVNFSLYGMIFLLGLYFQQARHATPAETGIAFLPLMATLTAVNVLSGRLAAAFGSRAPMTFGLLVGAVGFALVAMSPADVAPWAFTALSLPIFAGVGTAVPAMTSALLGAVPRERAGVASGVLNTVRQTAGAMGVATFGAFAAGDVSAGLRQACWAGVGLLAAGSAISAVWIRSSRTDPARGG